MRFHPLLVSTAVAALGGVGCADDSTSDRFPESDVTVAETIQPDRDTTGADTIQPQNDTSGPANDLVAVDTVQPLRASEFFLDPANLSGFLRMDVTSIGTRDGDTLWVGTRQGLYTVEAFAPEPRRVPAFAARPVQEVLSVVVRDNGEVLVLDSTLEVISSVDDGLTWTVVGLPSRDALGATDSHLVTDGADVLVVYGRGPMAIQHATGEPWLRIGNARPDMETLHGVELSAAAFGDDGKIYGNSSSFFAPGVHAIDRATATDAGALWHPVAGVDESAQYRAFAFKGGVGVTANLTDFFVRDATGWRRTMSIDAAPEFGLPEAPPEVPAEAIATDGNVFIASGSHGLRRSTDGVSWERLSLGHIFGRVFVGGPWGFSGAADGRLCGTNDSGDTWHCKDGPAAHADSVFAFGSSIVAFYAPNGLHQARAFRQSGEEVALGFGLPARTEQLVAANGVLYARTAEFEIYRKVGEGNSMTVIEADWGPNGHALRYKHLFGNSVGLFASDRRSSIGTAPFCGLFRHVPENALWAEADHGLPGSTECDDAPGIMNLIEVDGVLFAATDTQQTFRYNPANSSWVFVRDGMIEAVADCAGVLLALTSEGELWRSTDRGATFLDASEAFEPASALVSTGDGWCVAGRDAVADGPTLWAQSPNGNAWEPLRDEFTEPVIGLAGSAETLVVSTSSKGIIRVDNRR